MKRAMYEFRMLALMVLADVSIRIAPKTGDGLVWVAGMLAISKSLVERAKEEHGYPVKL